MPPKEPVAKSDFLRKFENRLSVVGRDGNVTKSATILNRHRESQSTLPSNPWGYHANASCALDALLGGAGPAAAATKHRAVAVARRARIAKPPRSGSL